MERRTFIQSTIAGVAISSAAERAAAQDSRGAAMNPDGTFVSLDPHDLPRVSDAGQLRGDMLYRTLGHTGEQVSLIGMGGAHLSRKPLTEQSAVKLIHAALDRGINFLDNSWDYGHGDSEKWMGTALSQGGYRNKAFLMTKLDGRTKEAANSQLEESLTRLKTDRIDLVQFHEILRYDDPDRIFAAGGALEALQAAKQAGKLRYIGFTGHKDPRIHLYMLDVAKDHGFRFDSVQMPLNVMDAHYRSFRTSSSPQLVRQNIGVLGMKTMGDGVSSRAARRSRRSSACTTHESADLGGDHRHRQAADTGPGLRSRAHLQADERRPGRGARGGHEDLRGRRQIRVLQDLEPLRHHRQASRLAGG